MINQRVAKRYAQALFEIAREKNSIEEFDQNLKTIIARINDNADVKKVVYGRLVSVKEKKEIVNKIFPHDIDSMITNFIYLVLDKSREQYLTAMGEAFDGLVAQEAKILPAKVRSAGAVTEDQVKRLEETLSRITGRNVKATVDVDPSLIGGLAVRIGDIVYDGSVTKKLGLLKEHLQHRGLVR